ncbi:MAG: hypothetical protein AAGA76_04600 [Pseudomonadota bacterium]
MPGKFIAVVGASGVGKDTILSLAKPRLESSGNFYFPLRYITREPDETGEEHLNISNAEFVQQVRDDRFSLWWSAHDLHYALPDDVYDSLRKGCHVVANISRRSVQEAIQRFSYIEVVEIIADLETCKKRLLLRGRESEAEIMVRQLRELTPNWSAGVNVYSISNDRTVSEAVDKFITTVLSLADGTQSKTQMA